AGASRRRSRCSCRSCDRPLRSRTLRKLACQELHDSPRPLIEAERRIDHEHATSAHLPFGVRVGVELDAQQRPLELALAAPDELRRRVTVLHRIPRDIDAVVESPDRARQEIADGVELVATLERRIDQHEPALLRQRQQRVGLVAVARMHGDARVASEALLERRRHLRHFLAQREAIRVARELLRNQWRAGIVAELAVGIERADQAQVVADRRILVAQIPKPGDAALELRGARSFVARKIVDAGAGVGLQVEPRRFLAIQSCEQLAQQRVLEDVGEIARVVAVLVVHGSELGCGSDYGGSRLMSGDNIQSVLQENRVFPPSPEFAKRARLDQDKLAKLRAEAEKDSVAFWSRLAREELAWKKPFTVGLDDAKAPNFRWFTDGVLNVSFN